MEQSTAAQAQEALLKKLRERYAFRGLSIPTDDKLLEGLKEALISDEHAAMHQNRATRRLIARSKRNG